MTGTQSASPALTASRSSAVRPDPTSSCPSRYPGAAKSTRPRPAVTATGTRTGRGRGAGEDRHRERDPQVRTPAAHDGPPFSV